jgi:regulatory protein
MNDKPSRVDFQKKKRLPRRITLDYLHNAGLYYLGRHAASIAHFRTILRRKIMRSCRHHTDQDITTCYALAEDIISKFVRSGLLNDETYAHALENRLRNQGRSHKYIAQKMSEKGLKSIASNEFKDHDVAQEEELNAAKIFARKRRLGPFASPNDQTQDDITASHMRDLGKFARAGFSFATAKTVLQLTREESV